MEKGFLDLVYAEQIDRSNELSEERNKILRSMNGEKGIDDFEGHPGSKVLRAGTKENGFYGFVQPSEMGEIEEGEEGFKEYNGANLCLAVGLSAGTLKASEVPLMKFSRRGKVLYVPLQGYRHSASWDSIYNAGLVYGVEDEGLLPPSGRLGVNLTISSADKSISTTGKDFLASGHTVGAVGDTITLKGWSKEGNNGDFTIKSITDEKIIVNETLVSESGSKLSRVYKKDNGVKQNKIVTIGGKKYRIRLLKGTGSDPFDLVGDRGTKGKDNEWNNLILPLHEKAKLKDWAFPEYAKIDGGIDVEYWGVGLTEANLKTSGGYQIGYSSWTQETSVTDDATNPNVVRLARGYHGDATSIIVSTQAVINPVYSYRPVLESI